FGGETSIGTTHRQRLGYIACQEVIRFSTDLSSRRAETRRHRSANCDGSPELLDVPSPVRDAGTLTIVLAVRIPRLDVREALHLLDVLPRELHQRREPRILVIEIALPLGRIKTAPATYHIVHDERLIARVFNLLVDADDDR